MTALVVDELMDEFVQPVIIKRDIKALSIKLHLYVHNMPSGQFKFQIFKGSDLYAEYPFSSADLRSSFGGTTPFFRVFYPVGVSSGLNLNEGQYTFKIVHTGYIFSASSFLAWCKDYQGVFGQISDPSVEFTEYPYSFRIIERIGREL